MVDLRLVRAVEMLVALVEGAVGGGSGIGFGGA